MKYNFFETEKILLYYDAIEGKWYISNKEKGLNYNLSQTENLSVFLHIFYEDPAIFFSNISRVVRAINLNEEIVNALPFKKAIIFCIQNKMFFWIELAFRWLEFVNIDGELKEAFKTIVNDSKSPQNIRHKLMKII